MAIKAHKTGPGSLKFGDTGSEVEFSIGVTNIEVTPELDKGDELVVLSGDRDKDQTESYTIKGKLLQSYEKNSLHVWAHINAGAEVPFTFQPRNDMDLAIAGSVIVSKIGFGGDVDKKNESDFEFAGATDTYDLIDAEAGTPITSYTP